jgi:hypothetical protein
MKLSIYQNGFSQEEINFGFEKFVENVKNLIFEDHKRVWGENFKPEEAPEVTVSRGRVYWKVITQDRGRYGAGQRSVYGFVRKADGAVLRAAGWAAPALNQARGFVTDEDFGASASTPHGIRYL